MKENTNNGWIKLYRKSLLSSVWQNESAWKVWCWCLMRANHGKIKISFAGKDIELLPGQFITGRFSAVKELNPKNKKDGLTPHRYRTAIKYLKSTSRITIESTNQFSIISIVNWNKYQGNDFESTSRITIESTSEQPTANQRLTTDKNDKNDKKLPPSVEKTMLEPDTTDSVIDLDTGLEESLEEKDRILHKGYNPKDTNILLQWGIEKLGRKFNKPLKQKKAIADMLAAGCSPEAIKEKWEELEDDKFWGDRGVDFSIVANQIDKKKSIKKLNPLLYGHK